MCASSCESSGADQPSLRTALRTPHPGPRARAAWGAAGGTHAACTRACKRSGAHQLLLIKRAHSAAHPRACWMSAPTSRNDAVDARRCGRGRGVWGASVRTRMRLRVVMGPCDAATRLPPPAPNHTRGQPPRIIRQTGNPPMGKSHGGSPQSTWHRAILWHQQPPRAGTHPELRLPILHETPGCGPELLAVQGLWHRWSGRGQAFGITPGGAVGAWGVQGLRAGVGLTGEAWVEGRGERCGAGKPPWEQARAGVQRCPAAGRVAHLVLLLPLASTGRGRGGHEEQHRSSVWGVTAAVPLLSARGAGSGGSEGVRAELGCPLSQSTAHLKVALRPSNGGLVHQELLL